MVALENFERPVAPGAAARGRPPLRVGVLVDLVLAPQAGGHVKCWERLARAATAFADQLDLTVHFTGPERRLDVLAPNVRYRIEPPVFSTGRLPFLSHVPDHTDLAPWHPRLARELPRYDVIHTTDAFFAYARTAMRVAKKWGIPIVTSVHTDTPAYARVYTGLTIERLVGRGAIRDLLVDRLGLARRVERNMAAKLKAHQRHCRFTLISRPEQLDDARAALGDRVGLLRRGIERELFTPSRRDRAWLAESLGVPSECIVVLFVGRLSRGKNVLFLAEAVARLVARGLPIHFVCAGEGEQRDDIVARLGDRVSCPGNLPPEMLARLYASADIFALPSPIEESANVVLEALASGLPVVVTQESGMGRAVVEGETGGTLQGNHPDAWTAALESLAQDDECRLRMGMAARRYAETTLPSWEDVLREDLLPRWQSAARAAQMR